MLSAENRDLEEQEAQKFLNVFGVYKKRFPWSPDYSKDASFLKELRDSDDERFEKFKNFVDLHHSSLWETADPSVKAKELSGIMDDFLWSEKYESYLAQQNKALSPENRSKLGTHLKNLEGKSFQEKMASAESYVIGTLGNEWERKRKQSKIGRLGNAYHATLGRHVFAPFNRNVIHPISSKAQALGETAIPKGKLVGLVLVSGFAALGALVLLATSLPVIATGGLGAAGLQLLGMLASGVVAGVAGSKVPEASKQLDRAEKVADSNKLSRDKEFQIKNDLYRDETENINALKNSKSLIAVKGISEKDFSGKALLDVRKGEVMLPEDMHLKYAGCLDIGFDRKTGQLLMSLKNIDGQTPEQNSDMIAEIVEACTGKNIGDVTVLGEECQGLDGVRAAFEGEAQKKLFDNRLKDLNGKLVKKSTVDDILSKALVTPSPKDPDSGGIARYAAVAASVLGVSSGNDQALFDKFNEDATIKLEAALKELTGDTDMTLTKANPVTAATTAIMGNVIDNYKDLSEAQKKLALARVVLGDVPDDKKGFSQTLATAAAIELGRMGVTQKQINAIQSTISGFEEDTDSKKIQKSTASILKSLDIKKPGGQSNGEIWKSAQEMLSGTFPGTNVDAQAWAVAQQQTVHA